MLALLGHNGEIIPEQTAALAKLMQQQKQESSQNPDNRTNDRQRPAAVASKADVNLSAMSTNSTQLRLW